MEPLGDGRVWKCLVGDRRPRWAIVASIAGLLSLASVAFLIGMNVGLYDALWGWIAIAFGIAVVAGVVDAGLVPTVGAVWLINLWGYAFPPLVGYLSGEWTGTGRYTHPRMAMFAYTSVRAELLGGLETSVEFGLLVAVILGTVGYLSGSAITWVARGRQSS
jgi:hypothetical protein